MRRGEAERERLLDIYVKEPLKHALSKTPLSSVPLQRNAAAAATLRDDNDTDNLVDTFLAGEDLVFARSLPRATTSTPQRNIPPSPSSLSAGPEEIYGDDNTAGDTTRYSR